MAWLYIAVLAFALLAYKTGIAPSADRARIHEYLARVRPSFHISSIEWAPFTKGFLGGWGRNYKVAGVENEREKIIWAKTSVVYGVYVSE